MKINILVVRYNSKEILGKMEREIYKFITGTYYQVSNLGNVRRMLDTGKFKEVNLHEKYGKVVVYLSIGKGSRMFQVRKLVIETFLGEDTGCSLIEHKDGDIWNNRIENLVNHQDKQIAKSRGKRQLSLQDARRIRYMYFVEKLSMSEISKRFPVNMSVINFVKNCIDGYYEDFDDPIYCAVYYADDPEIVDTHEPRIAKWRHTQKDAPEAA